MPDALPTSTTDSAGDLTRHGDNWLQRISVRWKLIAAFGLLLLMIVATRGINIVVQSNLAEASDWATHTQGVLRAFDRLRLAAADSEAGLEDAMVLRGAAARRQMGAGQNEFDTVLEELDRLTTDNPAQQVRLQRIGTLVDEWRANAVIPMQAAIRRGDSAETIEQLLLRGRDIRDRLLSEITRGQREEQKLLEVRNARMNRLLSLVQTVGWITLGIGIAIVLLSLRFTQRQVVAPLTRAAELMTRLVRGDRDFTVDGVHRGDELGELARGLTRFQFHLEELDRVATVKASVAATMAAVQSTDGIEDFAQRLLQALAGCVDAQIAIFYIPDSDGETLRLAGAIGLDGADSAALRFRPGEGLIGQAAVSRQPLRLSDLPPDYFRVRSGSGDIAPSALWIVPIIVRDRLMAMLELAAIAPFDADDDIFMAELLPVLGLSIENLMRARRTQELLSETQAQAIELKASEESLRTQEEELRATNETLQTNAQRLRASEEELRAQTEELQASNEELRQRTDQLAEEKRRVELAQAEIEDKARAVEKASRYKSEFLANMSHELRTPLNSLLILSRELAQNRSGNLGPDDVESAQYVHEAGASLLRLINDILDLSKIESGRMELAAHDLRLGDLAGELLRHFRHVAAEKAVTFDVTVEDGAPEAIRTDTAKLSQITNNLLSNAFKFTSAGGVAVTIGRGAAEGMIRIAVQDSGIGIPEDKLGKVFEAFEQVDASTSRKYGGTGLGLAIARNLARALGGDLTLESKLGEGSRFTLTLPERIEATSQVALPVPALPPSAPVPVQPAERADPPAIVSPGSEVIPTDVVGDDRRLIQPGAASILIVEDDLRFAKIMLDVVRSKNYAGLVAGDGESGIALARRYKPRGILLDVMLPGMDGWTVIERLKEDDGTRHIPVHFISATDEAPRARALGAIGFLTKPVTREDISDVFGRFEHYAGERMRRVLVVEDDDGVRLSVRKLIAAPGLEIVEAETGAAGLAQLAESGFDCIVLDLGLPDMDGFTFLAEARGHGEIPPVVVYSGRDLTPEENLRLHEYTDSVVIKGARSFDRLVDEVSLFLHSMRAPSPDQGQTGSLEGRNVLIVDDDVRNLYALAKALRAQGLVVKVVQGGQQALDLLDGENDIELVLMDIMMPGMDGYEAMRQLRQRPRYRDIPIIALTAKAMMDDRQKCLDAGASDYLPKPIDLDRLLSQMQVWLGGR
ncbi:CheY-like chemotaxis protein/CHASE3 domain sensor protein [Sphingomonas zeicaulis]|uniref:hybrid sensor histidine kinase/response regulator n=1 Tax=Sphingomonas zeicaulis TaxID=1632740 RepID=UPI003D20C444